MAGADLEQLRGAYADAVVYVAYLHTLLEDRKRAQADIMGRGRALGLPTTDSVDPTVGAHYAPVPEDAHWWRKQFLNPRTDYLALAVQEGQRGFASRNGQPTVYALHTAERQDEIRWSRSGK